MANISPQALTYPFQLANALTVGVCAGALLGFTFTYVLLTRGDIVSYFVNDLTRGQGSH